MTTEPTAVEPGDVTLADLQHDEGYAVDEAHAVDQGTHRQYWMIALLLAGITAVEVAIAYIDFFNPVIAPLLIGLALAKFVLVVGYFMHLKFDNPAFTRLFAAGGVGAVILYLVVLLAFRSL
jgi:cytochrome c oxidase subunit 4